MPERWTIFRCRTCGQSSTDPVELDRRDFCGGDTFERIEVVRAAEAGSARQSGDEIAEVASDEDQR